MQKLLRKFSLKNLLKPQRRSRGDSMRKVRQSADEASPKSALKSARAVTRDSSGVATKTYSGNATVKSSSTVLPESPKLKSRLLTVWILLILAGIGLGANLYRLQIVDGQKLTQRARNQQMVNFRPQTPRRLVVDRNREVLAIDRPAYTLSVHPKLFTKSNLEMGQLLGKILDRDPGELEEKFNAKKSGIVLSTNLAEETADRILGLGLNGIDATKKYSRFYPQQDLVSEVVGYVNVDRRGQAGVEYSQEKLLERVMQGMRMSRTGKGAMMPDHAPDGFINHDDFQLLLTIDNRLQRAARYALKRQIRRYGAKRGAVIVMDAYDGSLLALVAQPTYNSNEYSKADISLFKNWTVADLYEPGSTFKPLNVAIALELGAIKPDDTFNDSGTIKVSDRVINNSENKRYGRISIAQILQYSSNIGMVQISQRMRPNMYYGWLERLGLGQSLETDLPFAVASQLKSQEEFTSTPVEPATTSFGQGFSLTPLQLVQMMGSLANGGKLVTPHVVQGLVDSTGQMHYSPNRSQARQIFSPLTTQKVVEMMETVVAANGTGKAAQIPGYRIAGKTGTAQKASGGVYIKGARITSFVGILPVESPRYVVLAIVDEPKGENAYGGTVAAPIAKSVMEALITTEQIPPSSQRK
jgi:cell division protein FtsI (penicillin-binding protein 3)